METLPPATEADIAVASEAPSLLARKIRASGRKAFTVTTAGYTHAITARIGLTAETVVAHEVSEMRNGMAWSIGQGADALRALAGEDDRAVWNQDRIIAVIQPALPDPLVTWFTAIDKEGGRR